MATPVGAGPDERANIVRAAAAVRGDLLGAPDRSTAANANVYRNVTVPATFGDLHYDCFVEHPTVSAHCAIAPTASRSPFPTSTYVARYPPLYHLIEGLPSFLPGGTWAILMMRMAGSTMNAALLALAGYVVVTWSRSRALLLGLAFALSPMVFYFSAVVNPSGLEISSSICLWTAAVVWALDHPVRPPIGLCWVTTAAASVDALSRPLSLAWPPLVAVALAPYWLPRAVHATRRGSWHRLAPGSRRRRHHQVMTGLFVTCTAFAAGWLVLAQSLLELPGPKPQPGTSEGVILSDVIHDMPVYLKEGVGVLGWLDTFFPPGVYRFWYVGVLVLLGLGLLLGDLRGRMSVVLTMAFGFSIPVFSTVAGIHSRGFDTQGRYFVPLWVGLPIVSSAVAGAGLRRRLASRAAHRLSRGSRPGRHWSGAVRRRARQVAVRAVLAVLLLAVAAADVVSFGAAFRRNLVGINGPLLPWAPYPEKWAAPWSATLLNAGAAAATLLLVVLMVGIGPRPVTRSEAPDPATSHPAESVPPNGRLAGRGS